MYVCVNMCVCVCVCVCGVYGGGGGGAGAAWLATSATGSGRADDAVTDRPLDGDFQLPVLSPPSPTDHVRGIFMKSGHQGNRSRKRGLRV